MARETLEVLDARLETSAARHEESAGERDALAARLTNLQRAYDELVQRLRAYERERAEIRRRLERLVDRLGLERAASRADGKS